MSLSMFRCTSSFNANVSPCESGTYGPGCSLSCIKSNCSVESAECNQVTGQCDGGCQAGYQVKDCTQECSRGMYGPGCSQTCGNCSSDYHVTGKCPSGCIAGWRTEKCNEVCSNDTYGPDCTEKCGKCDRVCDSVDGRCPAGCLDGYCGIKCDLALRDSNEQELACFDVAYLVGAVVGTFLVVGLLAVGIHIYLIKQGRLQWSKTSEAKQSVQETRDSTQMSSIAPRPTENNPPGNQVHDNDYAAAVESGQMQGNKDYEFIQQKHYENL